MNGFDQVLVEQIGLALLHFLWQGAAIGLLYAASLPLTRRASAHTRYALAVLTLAALAAAPLLTLGLLLQAAAAGAAAPSTGAVTEPVWLSLRAAADSGAGAAGWVQWVVIAWFAGVVVLSARLLLGWHFLRRLRRSADFAAAEALQPRLRALLARLDIRRPVALAVSAGIRSPVVIGWLKPLVLLPPALVTGLPARQLEMVLAHELAHVRRLDHMVNLFQTVVETVLFYHPVVRWVSHRIRVERENACDDLAVSVTDDRLAYVEMLASLEKMRFSGPRLALAVHDGQMLNRIRRLVERGRPSRQLGLTGPALLATLLVAATASVQLIGENVASPSARPGIEAPATSEPALPAQDDAAVALSAPENPPAQSAFPEPQAPPPIEPAREQPGVAAVGRPQPSTDAPAPAGAAGPDVDDTVESPAIDPEPPALPSMETERLPPASELIELPRGRELAMLGRPDPVVPELPAPSPGRTVPTEEATLSGGRLIERIEPDYPRSARDRAVDGRVEVEFLVTTDGQVRDIEVIDERPRGLDFAGSAREAIARWRFEPFRLGGEAIERRVRVEVAFDLGNKDDRECRSVLGSRIPRCY